MKKPKTRTRSANKVGAQHSKNPAGTKIAKQFKKATQ